MMRAWKTLKRRPTLDRGYFLQAEDHTVELPDGRIVEDWPWLITPDYVNILAVTDDGQYLIFRQTKYAVDGLTLAPVGGYLEPGEDPLAAARRELREETGYEADAWHSLGRYVVDGNRGAGVAHLFLALDARPVARRDADDLEEQELLLLSRADLEAALTAGEFQVLGWATVVALGLLKLGQS